jgi:hypothetical protein
MPFLSAVMYQLRPEIHKPLHILSSHLHLFQCHTATRNKTLTFTATRILLSVAQLFKFILLTAKLLTLSVNLIIVIITIIIIIVIIRLLLTDYEQNKKVCSPAMQ